MRDAVEMLRPSRRADQQEGEQPSDLTTEPVTGEIDTCSVLDSNSNLDDWFDFSQFGDQLVVVQSAVSAVVNPSVVRW